MQHRIDHFVCQRLLNSFYSFNLAIVDPSISPENAISEETLASFVDNDGRVTDAAALRKIIFFRGIQSNVRRRVCLVIQYN